MFLLRVSSESADSWHDSAQLWARQ